MSGRKRDKVFAWAYLAIACSRICGKKNTRQDQKRASDPRTVQNLMISLKARGGRYDGRGRLTGLPKTKRLAFRHRESQDYTVTLLWLQVHFFL